MMRLDIIPRGVSYADPWGLGNIAVLHLAASSQMEGSQPACEKGTLLLQWACGGFTCLPPV